MIPFKFVSASLVQIHSAFFTLVVTYVDDLLVMGPDMGEIEVVKKQLKSRLNIRDLGSATSSWDY